MEQAQYATMFKALGDPTRLRIFQYLRSCCCGRAAVDVETGQARTLPVLPVAQEAPTVGAVCCQITGVDKITSSISAHLKELRLAGLITMERRGKHILCTVNPDALDTLSLFFAQEPQGSISPKESSSHGCC